MAAVVQTVLTNVFILGVNVGTGIITARLLAPTGRGEQAAIILWPQFLSFALTLGLPSALLYNLRRYPDRASGLFSAALLVGTVMGGVAVAVGALFIPDWLDSYSPEVVSFARWVMLLAPLVLLNYAFTFVLQAREEFAMYNAVRYLNPSLTLLSLGLLALTYGLTPFNSSLAYLLPTVPIFVWMLVRLWRIYRPGRRDVGWATRRLTAYGARAYGIDLLGQFSQQIDKVLVVGLLSPAAMGLYVVASSLSQMLFVFQAAAVSVLFPKASGRGVGEVVSLTGRTARVSTTVTVLGAVGLTVFSPLALGLLYGQAYLDAIPIFRLLLFATVLNGTAWVLDQALMAADRPGVATVLQSVGIGISVPLLLVLVPRYGLQGAGLALLISAATRFAFAMVSFPLVLKARLPRLWPMRSDLDPIVAVFRKKEKDP